MFLILHNVFHYISLFQLKGTTRPARGGICAAAKSLGCSRMNLDEY